MTWEQLHHEIDVIHSCKCGKFYIVWTQNLQVASIDRSLQKSCSRGSSVTGCGFHCCICSSSFCWKKKRALHRYVYIDYWILLLCLMLGQSQLLLCIIPSGRQYISHVLKKNWSLQMWSCMPSGPQSCIRSFSLSVHCCIVKKRAMTESHVAQHFSVLTWAPRPMMASMSIKTNVPSENRDLKAKCLSCNREARQMSHIFCLRRMKATFFYFFFTKVLWRYHVQFF